METYKYKYDKYNWKIIQLMRGGGNLCVYNCGRTTTGRYLTCCQACKSSIGPHTNLCDQRYATSSAPSVPSTPVVQPYIVIDRHMKPTDKSVRVIPYNFKVENQRGAHVEILNQGSTNIQFIPSPGSIYYVGSAFIRGQAIMRQVIGLKREDGHDAHITVYYNSDAVQRFPEFQ